MGDTATKIGTIVRAGLVLLGVAWWVNCAKTTTRAPQSNSVEVGETDEASASAPLSEHQARWSIERYLRARGWRVLVDVEVVLEGGTRLTLDGYDPQRGLGYEYLSVGEGPPDVVPGMYQGDFGRCVVVASADSLSVRTQVREFVERFEGSD